MVDCADRKTKKSHRQRFKECSTDSFGNKISIEIFVIQCVMEIAYFLDHFNKRCLNIQDLSEQTLNVSTLKPVSFQT